MKTLISHPSTFILTLAFSFIASASTWAEQENRTIDVFDLPSVKQQIIIEQGRYFPVINVMGEGLLAVFRGGGGHLGLGGYLQFTSAPDPSLPWSLSTKIVDGPNDDRNPAVGITSTGRIITAFHEQASYTPGGVYNPAIKSASCMFTISDDEGKTWSNPAPLGIKGLESCSPYGRIIQLIDGTLLMNVYGRYTKDVPGMKSISNQRRDYAYMVRSKDNGSTWGDPSLILSGHNETALLQMPDRRIMAAARSADHQQRLNVTLSADEGRTWSSYLRLTGQAQHPADLLLLSNGWILMVYGDRGAEEKVIRGMISRDWGHTWDIEYGIVLSRIVSGDFGYPSAVRLPDGGIALMYYWAGRAKDSYDFSMARAYLLLFNESEMIEAYSKMVPPLKHQ